jgi:Rieske Fe-S protein
MDVPRSAVRLAVLASVGLLVALVVVSVAEKARAVPVPIMDRAGDQPLAVPTEAGYTVGSWNSKPVAIVVAPSTVLDGVERFRGPGEATPSIALPGQPGLRLFALSASSTHLGCTVGFNVGLGASKDIADYSGDGLNDGRMLDPCHHGQWDVYHRGAEVPGTATGGRMAVLDVRIIDGMLVASGFDGSIGPGAKGITG